MSDTLDLVPDKLVILALYEFLKDNGVSLLRRDDYSSTFRVLTAVPGEYFVVGYRGIRGKVVIAKRMPYSDVDGCNYAVIASFAIEDPKCFDRVLEIVR